MRELFGGDREKGDVLQNTLSTKRELTLFFAME